MGPLDCYFYDIEDLEPNLKYEKMAISQPRVKKTKGTFFSSTLKVEEKKVPLFFGFRTSGLRYGIFVIFLIAKT